MTPISARRRSAGPGLLALLVVFFAGACSGDRPPVEPPHVTEVRLTTSSVVVELMDSARVSATVHLSDGTLAQRPIQWSCTRPELVQDCGPLIAPRDTGAFLLVARVGSVADTVAVRIYEEGMREVTITEPSAATNWFVQGGAVLIKVEITDSLGLRRFDRRLRWSSTDSSVAVVRDTAWWNWNLESWWPGGAVELRSSGAVRLSVTVGGKTASVDMNVRPRMAACDPARALALDLQVGELRRYRGNDAALPSCLQYRAARDAGRMYLLLAERLPVISGSQSTGRRGIFLAGAPAADSMIVQLYTPLTPAAQLAAARAQAVHEPPAAAEPGSAAWRIGTTHAVELPGTGHSGVTAVRPARSGAMLPHAAVVERSALATGDTLIIEGLGVIGRPPTDSISDRAVVRYVGENLVFAEHIELFGNRLRRPDGRPAGPIPTTEYARIDAAYGPGMAQLDRLFGQPTRDTIPLLPPGRDLVVNTVLPAGVWGTWRRNMAIIDYWYGTDGVTPGTLQDPLLLTNQLIVHEMAHMRHFQHQPAQPTLQWSMEGVARFAEHLAFAAHMLKSEAPSRSGNVRAGLLGYPTAPSLQSHIELPTAAALGQNFFIGYSASAHLFDYLADHAEAAGGNGLAAVRDVLLASHAPATADAAVARALGQPLTLDELITRARIALVLDDHPAAASLPSWTQYLQYDVRSSRPWSPNWPTLVPGAAYAIVRLMAEGVAWGAFIDGEHAVADEDFLLDVTRGSEAVISIVRIR
jgi:hypothetical protein